MRQVVCYAARNIADSFLAIVESDGVIEEDGEGFSRALGAKHGSKRAKNARGNQRQGRKRKQCYEGLDRDDVEES